GLSALGLLMQLAGNVFAAYAALIAFWVLFESASFRSRDSDTLWMFLVLGLSIGRSLLQRSAGAALTYGDPTQAGARLRGVERFFMFGVSQSGLLGLVAMFHFQAEVELSAGITFGLLVWPVTLAVLLALPRFKRFKNDLPLTEDKGFEGASILMTVLG